MDIFTRFFSSAPPTAAPVPIDTQLLQAQCKKPAKEFADYCAQCLGHTHEIKYENRFAHFDRKTNTNSGPLAAIRVRIMPGKNGIIDTKADFEDFLKSLKLFLGPNHENVIINGYCNVQDGTSYFFFDLDPKQLQNLKINELLPDVVDLTPEVNGPVYPVFANALFSPDPEWHCRGDRIIWNALSADLETTYVPKDENQLKKLLFTTFQKCTGHKLGADVLFPTSRLSSDGLSWKTHFIPVLLDRFKPIQTQQDLVQLKFFLLLVGSMDLASVVNKLPKEIVLEIGKNLLDVSSPKVSKFSEEEVSHFEKFLSEIPKPV